MGAAVVRKREVHFLGAARAFTGPSLNSSSLP